MKKTKKKNTNRTTNSAWLYLKPLYESMHGRQANRF